MDNLVGQLPALPRESLACGNAAVSPRWGTDLTVSIAHRLCGGYDHANDGPMVLSGVAVLPGGRGVLAPLTWVLHLPPSAVPLISDVRFCRYAQRLARLT